MSKLLEQIKELYPDLYERWMAGPPAVAKLPETIRQVCPAEGVERLFQREWIPESDTSSAVRLDTCLRCGCTIENVG